MDAATGIAKLALTPSALFCVLVVLKALGQINLEWWQVYVIPMTAPAVIFGALGSVTATLAALLAARGSGQR